MVRKKTGREDGFFWSFKNFLKHKLKYEVSSGRHLISDVKYGCGLSLTDFCVHI
jgi:hypothetical protein